MNLEAVLEPMRRLERHDLRERAQPRDGLEIDRHRAERAREGLGAAQREAAKVFAMGGADEDHARDGVANVGEVCIGARRDGTGVDVAGMRGDHRLGRQAARLRRREVAADGGVELDRIVGVEEARNCGLPNGDHASSMLRLSG